MAASTPQPGDDQVRKLAFDANRERIARVYATAFLDAARAAGQADEAVLELHSLVHDVVDKLPDMARVFIGSMFSHEHRERIITAALSGRALPVVRNLLMVLSQNDRLMLLRDVERNAHRLHGEANNRHQVIVRTAMPLDAQSQQGIARALQAKFGFEPELRIEVQPELIGGIVLQIGDTVYDGSVQTALERTRKAMVERAVEAIETTPNSFFAAT